MIRCVTKFNVVVDDSMNFQHLEEITRSTMVAVKVDCK